MHSQSASKKDAPEPDVSERPKRLRRWFRIRIWHLLLLLTLVAIPLGTIVQSARTEYEAFKELRDSELFEMELSDPPEFAAWLPKSLREAYGGLIFQDVIQLGNVEDFAGSEEERDFFPAIAKLKNIQRLLLDESYLGPTEVLGLQNKDALYELSLSDAVVVPETLARISTFASLETIWLDGSTVLGENLFTQERFPKLNTILASGAMLVDEAVLDMADLPLTHLELDQAAVSPRAFERVDMMQELDSLSLYGVRLDLASCERIGRLPKLRTLDIDSTAVSDEMLAKIAWPNSSIEALDISCCEQVTDAAIKLLLAMPRLKSLDVSGTSISSDGLVKLARHPTLGNLDLDDEQISWQLLENFQGTMLGHMGRSEIDDQLLKFPAVNDDSPPIVDFFEVTPQLPLRWEQLAKLPSAEIVRVHIDDASPGKTELQAFFSKYPTSNLDIYDSAFSTEHLPSHEYLCGLSLQNTELTDELFAKLNQYPHLFELDLAENEKLTGVGFSRWELPKELNSLVLRDLTLTRQDVKRLAALPDLEVLYFTAEPDVAALQRLLQRADPLEVTWKQPVDDREKPDFFMSYDKEIRVDLSHVSPGELESLLVTPTFSNATTARLYHASLEHLETLEGQVNWHGIGLIDPQDSLLSKAGAGALRSLSRDVTVRTSHKLVELVEFSRAFDGVLRLKCEFDGSQEELTAINQVLENEDIALQPLESNPEAMAILLDAKLKRPERTWLAKGYGAWPTVAELREQRSSESFSPMQRELTVFGDVVSQEKLESISEILFLRKLTWTGDVSLSHMAKAFQLQNLNLTDCHVTSELLHIVSKFPWLESVTFAKCTFERDCLAKLEDAWPLRDVSFFECQFEDDEVLHSLHLDGGHRTLYFGSCAVSKSAQNHLSQSFGPNVEVYVWD